MAKIEKFSVGGKEVITGSDVEEVLDVQSKLEGISQQCLSVEVTDEDSYEQAGNMLQSVAALHKLVEGTIEPFRQRAYDFYKGILAQKKDMLDPGDRAIKHLKGQIAAYVKRIEAQRRQEEQRLLEEARKAAESGDIEAALNVPEPETVVPTSNNVSTRSKWVADLTDMKALCAAIASGDAPVSLVTLNQSDANRMAKSLKSNMRVPGIRVREEKIVVRSGR